MKNINPGASTKATQEEAADPVADPQKAASHFSTEELVALANPKPTPEQDFSVRMRQRLEEKRKATEAQERKVRDESALYFLECDRCSMPALYFSRHPGNGDVIQFMDWFSELKPMGRKWSGIKITCQSCGVKVRGFYLSNNQGFVPDARFIRSIPPSEEGVREVLASCTKMRESMKQIQGATQ
jgi:hypothetical protein